MEEKKKGKKAWKIAAGIIGAVLIAAIIYCMASAMMPLGPGGVRRRKRAVCVHLSGGGMERKRRECLLLRFSERPKRAGKHIGIHLHRRGRGRDRARRRKIRLYGRKDVLRIVCRCGRGENGDCRGAVQRRQRKRFVFGKNGMKSL